MNENEINAIKAFLPFEEYEVTDDYVLFTLNSMELIRLSQIQALRNIGFPFVSVSNNFLLCRRGGK